MPEIIERKGAADVQDALLRISEVTCSIREMPAFYAAIHGIVQELMGVRNFYIALFDEDSGLLNFPYFAEEVDSACAPLEPGKPFARHVVRSGRLLLCSSEMFSDLVARSEVESGGESLSDWLGVPLKEGEKSFGVLAMRGHTSPTRFTKADKELLTFVSQHVAVAISRRRALEALGESERSHRRFVESLPQGYFFYRHDRKGPLHLPEPIDLQRPGLPPGRVSPPRRDAD